MRFITGRFLALNMTLLVIGGCGDGLNVKVSGKLLKGGAKYSPPEGHKITITLVAVEAKDDQGRSIAQQPYQALLASDGEAFTVPGLEGYGIPPGKYRVAVTQRMSREAFEATKPQASPGKPAITRETDFLDDRFSVESSPIIRDIKGGETIVVDLDKPE